MPDLLGDCCDRAIAASSHNLLPQSSPLPVVMLSTGVTATTGMLAVFADTTMAVAHVSAQLSGLLGLLLGHFESLLKL